MPKWLSITLAVGCWIWALMQSRMILVYRGKLSSQIVNLSEPSVNLASIAARSAITFVIFGFLFLFIPWPKVLTYICGVWTLRAIFDMVFCWLGKGIYAATAQMLTEDGRKAYLLKSFAKIIGNGVWFAVCFYFFGL